MICRRCRRENPPNARVCRYCNTPFYPADAPSGRSDSNKVVIAILIFLLVVFVCIMGTYAFRYYRPMRRPSYRGGGGGGGIGTVLNPTPSPNPGKTPAPNPGGKPSVGKKEPSVFKAMPNDFVFTSGAGGWATTLTIYDDGSFVGEYQDSDMGDTGTDYPNGTVYICNFSGKFSEPKVLDSYSYSMKVESLKYNKPKGQVEIDKGIRYISTGAYGLEGAYELKIYRPETPMYTLPKEFINWAQVDPNVVGTPLPLGKYGIYNVNDGYGFVPDA